MVFVFNTFYVDGVLPGLQVSAKAPVSSNLAPWNTAPESVIRRTLDVFFKRVALGVQDGHEQEKFNQDPDTSSVFRRNIENVSKAEKILVDYYLDEDKRADRRARKLLEDYYVQEDRSYNRRKVVLMAIDKIFNPEVVSVGYEDDYYEHIIGWHNFPNLTEDTYTPSKATRLRKQNREKRLIHNALRTAYLLFGVSSVVMFAVELRLGFNILAMLLFTAPLAAVLVAFVTVILAKYFLDNKSIPTFVSRITPRYDELRKELRELDKQSKQNRTPQWRINVFKVLAAYIPLFIIVKVYHGVFRTQKVITIPQKGFEEWFEQKSRLVVKSYAGALAGVENDKRFVERLENLIPSYLEKVMKEDWDPYNEVRLKICTQAITIFMWQKYPALFGNSIQSFNEVFKFASRNPHVVSLYDNADSSGKFGVEHMSSHETGLDAMGTIAHELGHVIHNVMGVGIESAEGKKSRQRRAFSEGFMAEASAACFYRAFMPQKRVTNIIRNRRKSYYGNLQNNAYNIGITQFIAFLLAGYEPVLIMDAAISALFRSVRKTDGWQPLDDSSYVKLFSPDSILLFEAA